MAVCDQVSILYSVLLYLELQMERSLSVKIIFSVYFLAWFKTDDVMPENTFDCFWFLFAPLFCVEHHKLP